MRVKKNKGRIATDRAKQLEQKLKMLGERTGNMESWCLETIRTGKERENLLQMLTTCVTLLIKDCIGRGLSNEETAALEEALDGPKGESNGATSEAAAGEPVQATGDIGGSGDLGAVGAGAPAE